MNKCTHLAQFVRYLFDEAELARKASWIIEGILKAGSPRLSDITRSKGTGSGELQVLAAFFETSRSAGGSVAIVSERSAIRDWGSHGEALRPHAEKTKYVGTLSDGQSRGYWLLFLATRYQGRAIPCHFVSYSSCRSRTKRASINEQVGDLPSYRS